MPWSHYIQRKFDKYRSGIARRDSSGSERSVQRSGSPNRASSALHELYHAILLECFCEDRYDVFPRFDLDTCRKGDGRLLRERRAECKTVDFVVEAFDGSPVLFVQISPDAQPPSPPASPHSTAASTDDNDNDNDNDNDETMQRLTETFAALSGASKVPRIYGLNAIGTEVEFYEYETDYGLAARERGAESTSDVAGSGNAGLGPRVEIMSDEGYERMMRVVDELEWMVQDLK